MVTRKKVLTSVILPIAMLLCLPILAACSNAESDLPQQRVSLSNDACSHNSPLGLREPYIINDQFLTSPLAGGTVRSGDFLISLYLICDPALAADDPESPEYSWQEWSEVRYLGLQTSWEYKGKTSEEDIIETLTINGEIVRERTIASLSDPERNLSYGTGVGTYGPLVTENQVVAQALAGGEPVEILLRFSSSKPLAGVRLRVSFQETADGYHLGGAEIREKP